MINTYITGDKVHSNASEAFSLYEKSRFGEKANDRIEYAWIEALYLLTKKQIILYNKNKVLNLDKAISKAKKHDKRIETKQIGRAHV